MDENIAYYNMTDYSYEISRSLHKQRFMIKKNVVLRLIREYIDDRLCDGLVWVRENNMFSNSISNIYEDDAAALRNITDIFSDILSVLISGIISDLKITPYSFVLSKLVTRSETIYLEVENCGDYRIVTYELANEGYKV